MRKNKDNAQDDSKDKTMAHNEDKNLNYSLHLDIKIDLNPFVSKDFINEQNTAPYKLEGKKLDFLAQFNSKYF